MAVSEGAAGRRRAQRRLAREIAEKRHERVQPQLNKAGQQARIRYANEMLKHPERKKDLPKAEKIQLARMAAYANQGRGNPEWVGAYKEFWYHKNDDNQSSD